MFFGRLKMRFRCLLNPIYLKYESQINDMFVTCCVIHNMLLSYDGFDTAFDDPLTWHFPEDAGDDETPPGTVGFPGDSNAFKPHWIKPTYGPVSKLLERKTTTK